MNKNHYLMRVSKKLLFLMMIASYSSLFNEISITNKSSQDVNFRILCPHTLNYPSKWKTLKAFNSLQEIAVFPGCLSQNPSAVIYFSSGLNAPFPYTSGQFYFKDDGFLYNDQAGVKIRYK